MRQPKIILIFRHKCVVFFSVNTQSVTVTYWKSSFVRCLTMNVACQGRTLSQTVCLCVVSQSQAVTFECRVVHRSDGLCGDMPIGENITREIMEFFFKCCISYHQTSTLNHAKNRYYTKSVACTPLSLFLLRTEELATEY